MQLLSAELAQVLRDLEDAKQAINEKYAEAGTPEPIEGILRSGELAEYIRKITSVGMIPVQDDINLSHNKKIVEVPGRHLITDFTAKIEDYYVIYIYNKKGMAAKIQNVVLENSFQVPDFGVDVAPDGDELKGWSHMPDDDDPEYETGDMANHFEFEPRLEDDNNIAFLYAVWQKFYNYSLTYNLEGGSGGPSPEVVTHTTEPTHVFMLNTMNIPTKNSYNFKGWGDTPGSTTPITHKTASESNPDVAVYAIWEVVPCVLSGQVIDGVKGTPITVSSTIVFKENGNVVTTITSDSGGNYSTSISSGKTYTAEVTAEEYEIGTFTVVIPANAPMVTQDFVLMPTLQVNEIVRSILTWGAEPRDLDTHVVGICNGTEFHCSYQNKSYPIGINTTDDEQKLNAVIGIDIDDTTSYGPETFTFRNTADISDAENNTKFVYFVHRFSSDGELTTSGGRVRIVKSSGSNWDVSVPTSGTGRYWAVFKYENGTVTILNQILDSEPAVDITPGTTPTTPDPQPDTPDVPDTSEYCDLDVVKDFTYNWGYEEIKNDETLKKCYARIYNAFMNNGKKPIRVNSTDYEALFNGNSMGSGWSTYNGYLYVPLDDLNITPNQVYYIKNMVQQDCPETIWQWKQTKSSTLGSIGDNVQFLLMCHFDQTTWDNYNTKINATFNEITSLIKTHYNIDYIQDTFYNNNRRYTENQKKKIVKVIHDYIETHNHYGDTTMTPDANGILLNQIVYPALSNGAADPVCASYAQAFKYCCNRWGISCIVVEGHVGNERDGNHAWNMISYKQKTPGELKSTNSAWQEVDCTWDDPSVRSTFNTYGSYGITPQMMCDACRWDHYNVTTAELNAGITTRDLTFTGASVYFPGGQGATRYKDVYEEANQANGVNADGSDELGVYKTYPTGTCSTNKYTGDTVYGGL